MKTTYLDNEIILLEGYKKEGTASPYQLRKLAEYREIKQLTIPVVVGQSEQLKALEELKDFAYDNCQPHNSDRLAEIMERF